jgi:hypothetical protein
MLALLQMPKDPLNVAAYAPFLAMGRHVLRRQLDMMRFFFENGFLKGLSSESATIRNHHLNGKK